MYRVSCESVSRLMAIDAGSAIDISVSTGEAADQSSQALEARRSPVSGDQAEADWKLAVIQPIRLRSHPNTADRAAMVREAAETVRYAYGRRRGTPVGEKAIRNWIKAYETDGLAGLRRKVRSDARRRRVVISRQWDVLASAAGIGETDQMEIAGQLRRRIASLWSQGVPSWPTVQLSAMPFLLDLTCRTAGVQPDGALREACMPPRTLVEASRHYRAVAIRRKDAGRSAATQTPRIRRNRSRIRPMEWVAGDVHHIDIAFRRDDGSLCTIKAVAWLDLATNRTFVTPFLMPKGQMIRREHVIESFVAMCSDQNWGVPSRLYVDNGGEYNWGEVVGDLCKIKDLSIRTARDLDADLVSSGMRKSRPYNPQSKVIESLFASLERVAFSQLPGHIGGDRMKKKTENQGKEPVPYPGGFDDYRQSLLTAIDYYHCKGQSGHLAGKSPAARFRKFVDEGWSSTTLDPAELAIVFSREDTRQVRPGGTFSWDGITYRHDALLALSGIGTVLVRAPLFGERTRLFVFDEDGAPLCIADPETTFDFDDIAGAGEQQRRTAELNRQIRALEASTDRLDPEQVMAEVVAAHGPGAMAPIGGTVTVNASVQGMARIAQKTPPATTAASRDTHRRRDIFRRLADRGAA